MYTGWNNSSIQVVKMVTWETHDKPIYHIGKPVSGCPSTAWNWCKHWKKLRVCVLTYHHSQINRQRLMNFLGAQFNKLKQIWKKRVATKFVLQFWLKNEGKVETCCFKTSMFWNNSFKLIQIFMSDVMNHGAIVMTQKKGYFKVHGRHHYAV